MFEENILKKGIAILIGTIFITSCASIKKNNLVSDEALLITNTRFILMGNLTDSFKPDDDPMTVEYVFIDKTSDTKSWVSEDGQVIYVNTKYDKGDSKKHLVESTSKRLAIIAKK